MAKARTLLCAALLATATMVLAADTLPIAQAPTRATLVPADGSFALPSDVAADGERIWVVDSGHHRVAVFGRDGKPRFVAGSRGAGAEQLDGPVGIGLADDGRAYVADRGNRRIQVISPAGKFVARFETRGPDGPVTPVDVALGPGAKPRVYVTSASAHAVLVFDHAGKFLEQRGSQGTNAGQFRYPATLIAMPDERLAVVDVLNSRVQILEGARAVLEVASWGVLPGRLFRPKGIARDGRGRLYVSDSYLGVIQSFDDNGRFLHVLGEQGAPLALDAPAGLAISGDRLVVAQMLGNKVTLHALPE